MPGFRAFGGDDVPLHEYSGYCTAYLGDIGVPRDPAPMDFSAWFEAFLGGNWYTFDARHNRPRIGHILIGRGRDAADVAISTTFGTAQLARFSVVTEELDEVKETSASLVPSQAQPPVTPTHNSSDAISQEP